MLTGRRVATAGKLQARQAASHQQGGNGHVQAQDERVGSEQGEQDDVKGNSETAPSQREALLRGFGVRATK